MESWIRGFFVAVFATIVFLGSLASLIGFIEDRFNPIDIRMFSDDEHKALEAASFGMFAEGKTSFSSGSYRSSVESANDKTRWLKHDDIRFDSLSF